jgi:hypothetical protein
MDGRFTFQIEDHFEHREVGRDKPNAAGVYNIERYPVIRSYDLMDDAIGLVAVNKRLKAVS